MTPSERKWVLIFSIIILSITTLPYLIGFWQEGSGWQFSGFFMGVEDGNSYIAKMLLGSAGEWLFKTPYTAFAQSGFLAFVPYLLLGKLTAPPGQHAQLVALFQIFRWAGGLVMIFATYQVVSRFISDVKIRQFGTIIAVVGGGLGWLNLFGFSGLWSGRLPLEFYSPETFGFLSLFTLPHLSMARGLLLFGILAYWRGYDVDYSGKTMILNGLLWVVLGLMQPLTVAVGWMVVGLDIVIRFLKSGNLRSLAFFRQRGVINGAVMGVCSAPIVVYTIVSFTFDPFLRIWSAQNIIQSPPPGDYLLGYLVLLPFLFLGARQIFRRNQIEEIVILAWLILVPLLAYFPYNLQRRLPEGTWVAMVITAMIGLKSLSPRLLRIGSTFLSLSLLSSVLILTSSIFAVLQIQKPVYQPADEVNSFLFLGERASNFPTVMAAYSTSNELPAWAPVRTVIGHGPESVHLKDVEKEVGAFFNPATGNDERIKIIDQFSIRYLIWGPAERDMGTWNPADWSGLNKIYQNTTVQIFEVNP